MDLEKFNQLMFATANDAKIFLSLLIGHYPQQNASTPVLAVFQSLKKEWREDDTLFSPLFLKYFNAYDFTEENYPYYEHYSKKWSADKKQAIEASNKGFQIIIPKIEYKNSLEFSKAVEQQFRYNHDTHTTQSAYPFIEAEHETVVKLIKKDKKKFVENFMKRKIWGRFISLDYLNFKKFCHEFEIDQKKIMQDCLVDSFYGFREAMNSARTESGNFEQILEDIKKWPDFFHDGLFFTNPWNKDSGYRLNLIDTALYFIGLEHLHEAGLLINAFPEQAKILFTAMTKFDDIFSNEAWQKHIEAIIERDRYSYHGPGIRGHEVSGARRNIESIGDLMKTYSLYNTLSKMPVKETDRKKIKI